MRDLYIVLENMVKEIPIEETQFIKALGNIKESVSYCPPENIGMWWNVTSNCLLRFMPNPNSLNEWEQKVVNIFMDIKNV